MRADICTACGLTEQTCAHSRCCQNCTHKSLPERLLAKAYKPGFEGAVLMGAVNTPEELAEWEIDPGRAYHEQYSEEQIEHNVRHKVFTSGYTIGKNEVVMRVRDFLTTAHEIADPDLGDVMVVYADDLRALIEEES